MKANIILLKLLRFCLLFQDNFSTTKVTLYTKLNLYQGWLVGSLGLVVWFFFLPFLLFCPHYIPSPCISTGIQPAPQLCYYLDWQAEENLPSCVVYLHHRCGDMRSPLLLLWSELFLFVSGGCFPFLSFCFCLIHEQHLCWSVLQSAPLCLGMG